MLTLKVVSADRDGQRSTFLISGASISYNKIKANTQDSIPIVNGTTILGIIPKTEEVGNYNYFGVRLRDNENAIIEDLCVFPYSECFVMENGKTVDMFVSDFVE